MCQRLKSDNSTALETQSNAGLWDDLIIKPQLLSYQKQIYLLE